MKNLFVLALTLSLLSVTSVFAATGPVKIELGTGTSKDKEAMVFSKEKLSAKAGYKVSLYFKNNGTAKGMTHNFVLVKPGKAQAVIDASISAGPDKAWVAETPDVLAKTQLVDAGESVTITFTAPSEPGDYPYICTFPGHATMKGVLKVTK